MAPAFENNSRRAPAVMPGIRRCEHLLDRITGALSARFISSFNSATVERCVWECYAGVAGTAAQRVHLPVLAQRAATDQLAALAAAVDPTFGSSVAVLLLTSRRNLEALEVIASMFDRHASGGDPSSLTTRQLRGTCSDDPDSGPVSLLPGRGGSLITEPFRSATVENMDVVITLTDVCAVPLYAQKLYLNWRFANFTEMPVDWIQPARAEVEAQVAALSCRLHRLGVTSVTVHCAQSD